MKTVGELEIKDYQQHPVWEFINDDREELAVRPVLKIPVTSMITRFIGTKVRLASGREMWASIGNVDLSNALRTEQFLDMSIDINENGQWVSIARYFDSDYERHGPKAFAEALGMAIDDVFPISYDLRPFAEGEASILVGSITKEPRRQLTRQERMRLSVRGKL